MITPELNKYITTITGEFDAIPEERQKLLIEIAHFINYNLKNKKETRLVFICTHNSRRSHISQIWAQTASSYYGIPGIQTYSGGTEESAFNIHAVEAMRDAGFRIIVEKEGKNPVYKVTYHQEAGPVMAYSKKYDDHENPKQDFCAIMTCSDADHNCPFIPGAVLRIALPYQDPKEFDGTTKQKEAYTERTHQIAREMFYLFSQVD
jgi:protein-tyrosine-phosphatase